MKKFRLVLLALIALTLSAGVCFSQETEKKEKKGSYYSLSTYKVNFSDLGDFLKIMESFNEAFTKNEFVLSHKVMTHVWGEDWTVIAITEYADFASIEKAQIRMNEIGKEIFPDAEKQKERIKEYQKMIKGHYDSIVKEVASLTK